LEKIESIDELAALGERALKFHRGAIAKIEKVMAVLRPAIASAEKSPKPARKARSDKGVAKKKGAKVEGSGIEAAERLVAASMGDKRAPVGSPEVLTEPGAEEVAGKPGTFRG
jgi:hypothetical protein